MRKRIKKIFRVTSMTHHSLSFFTFTYNRLLLFRRHLHAVLAGPLPNPPAPRANEPNVEIQKIQILNRCFRRLLLTLGVRGGRRRWRRALRAAGARAAAARHRDGGGQAAAQCVWGEIEER